jgi:hypothetical protein
MGERCILQSPRLPTRDMGKKIFSALLTTFNVSNTAIEVLVEEENRLLLVSDLEGI